MLQLYVERVRRDWSQTFVSSLCGIAQSDLSAIERGKKKAYPGWRRRLAKAYGLPEELLFREAGDPAKAAR